MLGSIQKSLLLFCGAFLFLSFENVVFAQDTMQYPISVVVNQEGTVFVADRKLPGIWKITAAKAEVYFQASKKFRSPLNAIRCLALDHQGALLAGDSATREVYRFSKEGKPQALTQGKIGIPSAIAVNKQGTIFVSDLETRSIVHFPATGGKPETFVNGIPVRGLEFDADNGLLVVSSVKNQLLHIAMDKKMEILTSEKSFQFPHHVAIDSQGNRYIADGYAKTIWKLSAESSGEKPEAFIADSVLRNPVGLTWHKNELYVADSRAKAVFLFDQSGKLKGTLPAKKSSY